MEIALLKEFVVLAEDLNYSSAAERLYISQSSLSKHIKKLEQDLGVLLFERTTRKIALTDIGEKCYINARRLILAWDAIERDVNQKRHADPNHIVVHSIRSVHGSHNYGLFVNEFLRNNDGCRLDNTIITETTRHSLHRSLSPNSPTFFIDFKINFSPVSDMLNFVPLARDSLCVAIHQSNPASKLDKVTFDILQTAGNKFIVSSQAIASDFVFADLFSKQRLIPNYDYIFSTLPDRILAVQENLGYTVVQRNTYRNNQPASVRLVDFDPPYDLDLVLAYHKDRILTPLEKEFIDRTVQYFKIYDSRFDST